VNVTSANTMVGTISTSPVTIAGGSVGATTQFIRGNSGSSDLTVSTPAGFNTPTILYTKVTANVATQSFSLACDGVAIGQNLEASCTVGISPAAPAGGVLVTLTSNNPSLVLLSATSTAAGSPSIMITIPAGSTSATYYAQALSASGTATHTASASGFASRTATTPLAPSGVVIAPNGQLGTPFLNASVSAGAVPVNVYMAVLNGNSFSGSTQALRGGLPSLQVSVSSSNTGVGTIVSPVTITSGSDNGVTQFTPVSQGNTTLSVATPTGYTTSSNDTTVSVMVSP
jgi:hypothetical protein